MNNKLSISLNAILLIAVGVLYYFHFSGKDTGTDSAGKPVLAPKEIKSSKIVYVNLDTLNEQYEFLKDISAVAKSSLQSLQSQYDSQSRKLQEEYMAFQENVQKGLFTEKEAQFEQELLMKKKEKIDAIELESQKLVAKIDEQNLQANKNLKEYVAAYNKKSNYTYVLSYTDNLPVVILADSSLDITAEILEGLNLQYEQEKASKKKK